MKIYLLENYNSNVTFDENSIIVALTPDVCYCLDKAGIKYSIIEDYYSEVQLSLYADEYYEAQIQWINELDEFLQKNVEELRELNLKMGAIYSYFIKTRILDPLYMRCFTLRRLLEAKKPSGIVFVSNPSSNDTYLDFRLQASDKSYYSLIIPVLCSENNIPLTSVLLEEDGQLEEESKAIKRSTPYRISSSLPIRVARGLHKRSTIMRRMYSVFNHLRRYHFLKQSNQKRLNIFMLRLAHIGEGFAIDALNRNHSVFNLSGDFINKYYPFGSIRYLNLKAEYADKAIYIGSVNIWERTANLLKDSELIKWISIKCQLDVSEITLPRLKYFVSKVCPEILGYFKVFVQFYDAAKINIVFTSYEWFPVDFAAIAAANHIDSVTTVSLAHGDGAEYDKSWESRELRTYDVIITSNLERKKYYERLSAEINSSVEIFRSPHRLLGLNKIRRLRHGLKAKTPERIIYLTTFMLWETRPINDVYPDTWYYKFQTSLIEHFSTRAEYTFVWKGLPASDVVHNPIPNFIRDSDFSNIEISTNPFIDHLLQADRVICDYPSTGFYEAVFSGVPTMSLYHKSLIVRKSAVDYFGNLLKLFSDIPEAIKHVDEFLNSDPELYKMTIDMGDEKVIDILEKAAKRNKS